MKLKPLCCFLIANLLFVNISFADTYRANGEVFLIDEQPNIEWNSRIFSAVVSEEPLIIEQGGHVVSLLFVIESPPSINYSLTVTLKTNPKSTDEISTTLFSNTYQANLVGGSNGPFDFEVEQSGLRFGGAVGLSLRK